MNDYRNFQRKTSRKKGTNFNKDCKGKHCLKQKNKYTAVISNRQRQLQQSKHSQRCDKFLTKSQHEQYLHDQITRGSFSRVINYTKEKHILSQEQLDAINVKNGFEILECKYRLFLKDMSPILQLNCIDCDGDWRDINSVNFLCVRKNNNVNHTPKRISHCNMKQDLDCSYSYNCKENMLTRMPCDVFLYCICDKYLYPNEIFLLLTLSKNIYQILTNGNLNNKYDNKSLLHQIISKERLIQCYLDIVNELHKQFTYEMNNKNEDGISQSEDLHTRRIHLAEQFGQQIRSVMGICGGVICWLEKTETPMTDNYSCKCPSIVITDEMPTKLNVKAAQVIQMMNNCLKRHYKVACYILNMTSAMIHKIIGLQPLVNGLIKKFKYLFVLTVSKLIRWSGTHTIANSKMIKGGGNYDDNGTKISIVCNEKLSDFFMEKILTNRIIDYLALSNCNYLQNDRKHKLTPSGKNSRLILQSVVKFIQLSTTFHDNHGYYWLRGIKCSMRLYFDTKSITCWKSDNRPIVWSNHKYTLKYPMWNEYFVDVSYKLRYKNKVIKCLSLNKIFEKYQDIQVGDHGCDNSKKFKLVSTLGNLKNCNCIFLLVSVDSVSGST